MCIGVTLKSLDLRTSDYSRPELEAGASIFENRDCADMFSSDDEDADPESELLETQPDVVQRLPTEGQDPGLLEVPATEALEGRAPKMSLPSSRGGSKQSLIPRTNFFDRTLKENRGVPLVKEFSLSGLAVYIDSGPETVLISFLARPGAGSIAWIEGEQVS